jgi:hypothetical protein
MATTISAVLDTYEIKDKVGCTGAILGLIIDNVQGGMDYCR